ncbi:hypothetical protein JCM10213_002343 [Rhodosporidiobolus nylandii]
MPHALHNPLPDPLLSQPLFSAARTPTSRGPLHPGSTWAGVQRSGRSSYEVRVKIDTVDVAAGTVCGTLEIKGLTPDLDSLVTFFEGEIIGEPGLPGLKTGKYGATEADDLKHWRRFPAFTRNQLEKELLPPHLNLRDAQNKPQLFMRWKEQFVVPTEGVGRGAAIHGASFAGFYYCCLDLEPSARSADPSVSAHRGISPAPRPSFRARPSSTTLQPGSLSQSRIYPSSTSSSTSQPSLVDLGTTTLPPIVNLPPRSSRPAQPRLPSIHALPSVSSASSTPGGPTSSPPSFIDLSSPTTPTSSSHSTSTSADSPVTAPLAGSGEDTPMAPPPTELRTPKNELPSLTFATAVSDNPDQAPQVLSSSSAVEQTWSPSSTAPASGIAPHPASLRHLRRMSSDVATVLAKARGRRGHKRRSSIQEDFEEPLDDCGLRSWTDATISGFYFHHSASPYQELSLRYVPSTQGGSAEFTFR